MADPAETAPPNSTPERRGRRSHPDSETEPPRFAARSTYSRFVATMKVVLPALAVAIILLVLVWPRIVPEDSRFRIGLSELGPGAADNLSMVNPRFQGRDNRDRPFTIVAQKATQVADDTKRITLDRPEADITLADGAWVALTADSGVYHRQDKTLDLRGHVSLFHDQGFEMHTTRVQIDLASAAAHSDSPVEGHGPAGTLNAQGFRVRDQGQTIVLTGKSRLVVRGSDTERSQ